jgi:hypothetical protein
MGGSLNMSLVFDFLQGETIMIETMYHRKGQRLDYVFCKLSSNRIRGWLMGYAAEAPDRGDFFLAWQVN